VAQLDVFGWLFLALAGLRYMRQGEPLPPLVSRAVGALKGLPAERAVKAAIVCTGILYFSVLCAMYGSFSLEAYDLGFVGQAIWSAAHLPFSGGFLHSSLSRGGTCLGEHFSPVLAVISPLVKLFPSRSGSFVYALFFSQAALASLSAWLLYLLARQRKLGAGMSAMVALLFLLYQPLRAAAAQSPLREDLFFVPFTFGALLALERGRLSWLWLCAVGCWLTKENSGIVTGFLAVGLFLKGRRGQGAALALASLAAFWFLNAKVMPAFAPVVGDIGTVASRRLTGPLLPLLLSKMEWKTMRYLTQVLLPFVVVAVPCWSWLAVGALMAMNLLISLRTVGFHYECIVMPFLFYGLITALKARSSAPRRELALVFATCALFAVFGRSPVLALGAHWPSREHRCMTASLATLPPAASVATQSGLFPHLMARRDIFLRGLPEQVQEDYLVTTKLADVSTYATPLLHSWVDGFSAARPDYRLLFEDSRLKIWCHLRVCTATNTLAALRALSNIQASCSTP
jgi:uncharacterized membrane protein